MTYRGSLLRPGRPVKGGGRGLWDSHPAALSHQVRFRPDLGAFPGEGAPHPSRPTLPQARGRTQGGRANSFQCGKGTSASPSPCPPLTPRSPSARAPASLGVTPSSASCPRGVGGRAPDPDADADRGPAGGGGGRSRSLRPTCGLPTPPSAAQLTAARASAPPPGISRAPPPSPRPLRSRAPRRPRLLPCRPRPPARAPLPQSSSPAVRAGQGPHPGKRGLPSAVDCRDRWRSLKEIIN